MGNEDTDLPVPDPVKQSWWKRLSYGRRVAIGVGFYIVIGGSLVLELPKFLIPNWVPALEPEKQGAFIWPAAQVVLFALGGAIAAVGVGLSLSRHREELDAAERDRERLHDDRERELARRNEVEDQRHIDQERELRARFVTLVGLLADSAPTTRQAALYGLGALADDWDRFGNPEEVQVCIEVITAYRLFAVEGVVEGRRSVRG